MNTQVGQREVTKMTLDTAYERYKQELRDKMAALVGTRSE